jgi:hypothetical protein
LTRFIIVFGWNVLVDGVYVMLPLNRTGNTANPHLIIQKYKDPQLN